MPDLPDPNRKQREREEDAVLLHLVEHFAPGGPTTDEECPDAELLGAILEHRLPPERRPEVEEHLDRCATCRTLVAELASQGVGTESASESIEAGVPSIGRGSPVLRAAAAVIVVSLIGFGYWLSSRTEEGDSWTRLTAAHAALEESHAGLFSSATRPVSSMELDELSRDLLRSGEIELHYPVGSLLGGRPDFRWESVAGVEEYGFVLLTLDGTELHKTRSKTAVLPFPLADRELAAGIYLWQVTCQSPTGELVDRRTFTVSDPDERRNYRERMQAIAENTSAPLRALLTAHVALRASYFFEAKRACERYYAAVPEDRSAAETLARLRKLVGEKP